MMSRTTRSPSLIDLGNRKVYGFPIPCVGKIADCRDR